jgi:hypothetical protein
MLPFFVDSSAENLVLQKLCDLNKEYLLSPSYPQTFFIPRCLDNDTVLGCANFRSKGRLPVLSWFNPRMGNAMVRCAQPNVGATGLPRGVCLSLTCLA